MDDEESWTVIDGNEFGLGVPSGLALVDDTLLVGDYSTGNIFAFDLDGNLIDWTATGLEGLMGIEARSIDDIWVVDAASDRVLRMQP